MTKWILAATLALIVTGAAAKDDKPVKKSAKAASAAKVTIGKSGYRRMLCESHSAKTISGYVYTAAGLGESTTDVAWDGQAMICENGDQIVESERFSDDEQLIEAMAYVSIESFTAMINVAGEVPIDGSAEESRTLRAA